MSRNPTPRVSVRSYLSLTFTTSLNLAKMPHMVMLRNEHSVMAGWLNINLDDLHVTVKVS